MQKGLTTNPRNWLNIGREPLVAEIPPEEGGVPSLRVLCREEEFSWYLAVKINEDSAHPGKT